MAAFIGIGVLAAGLTLPPAIAPTDLVPSTGISVTRPLTEAIVRDAPHEAWRLDRAGAALPAAPNSDRNWIERHPSLFGAAVGFGGGFLIGYLPGDDAVFDDFTAEFNGLVLGGVGAAAGAIVGWLVGR